MKYIVKDQFRKIRHQLVNVISLSLLVIVISMTYTAVESSIRRLNENYENYLETQQLEDFYFNMGNIDVNYLGGTALIQLCNDLDITYECGYALSFPDDPTYINNLNIIINDKIKDHPEVYENLMDSYASEFADRYDLTIEKSYVVDVTDQEFIYKFISTTTEIDIPYIVDGLMPTADNEIAIFPEFAKANNLSIGDSLTINDHTYTITGFMYKPEYLFPIFSLSTISFDSTKQTIVLSNKQTIENLNEFVFVKYLVQGDLSNVFPSDYGYSDIQSNDFSLLGKHMQMLYILMPSDINFRVIALDSEITNAHAFINVFLPLFTALITMLLLVFMRRYISKNKEDIKILRALGYSDNELSLALLIYPLVISSTVIIGYLLGLLLSGRLFNLYSARYLFPKAGFSIYPDIIFYAVVIPMIAITVINYIFIRLTLRKQSTKSPHRKLRISKFIETKTILSTALLFITISIMIVFGLSGNTMFKAFVDETKLGNNYSEMVNLQYMTNTDHFDTYETYTKMPGKIIEVNSRALKNIKSTTIYGISPDSTLKRLINNDISKNSLLNDGIIISDYLHTSLSLNVGDTVTFEVGGLENTATVVGVSNELIENNFYMNQTELNSYFNLDDTYYNGLYTTDYDYVSPYVIGRIDYQNSIDEMSAILNISSLILNYIIILSVILSLFIFVLVLVNYFMDHKLEIAILKSLGYNNYEINKKYLLLIYILMILLYIISIPITNYILNYMLGLIMETIGFKLIVDVSVLNMIIGFVTLQIIFVITTYYVTKFYDSIQVADLLKRNIK